MSAVTPAGGDTAAGRSWPEVLSALLGGQDLSAGDTAWAMDRFMSGEATDAQIAGFMVALRAKGETVEEITGLVDAMYAHAQPLDIPGPAVDIVGTGGDRAKTVNISTMSAIVIAGTGAKVVKHGNRASSSASGSSDVLEKLGDSPGAPTARGRRLDDQAALPRGRFAPTYRITPCASARALRAGFADLVGREHEPGHRSRSARRGARGPGALALFRRSDAPRVGVISCGATAGTARTSPPRSPRSTASASATASSAPTRGAHPASAASPQDPRRGECARGRAAARGRSNAIRVSFGAGTPDEHCRARSSRAVCRSWSGGAQWQGPDGGRPLRPGRGTDARVLRRRPEGSDAWDGAHRVPRPSGCPTRQADRERRIQVVLASTYGTPRACPVPSDAGDLADPAGDDLCQVLVRRTRTMAIRSYVPVTEKTSLTLSSEAIDSAISRDPVHAGLDEHDRGDHGWFSPSGAGAGADLTLVPRPNRTHA
ncbi:Anthranilate phosphoribosyltransferase [Streptomyces alboniger]